MARVIFLGTAASIPSHSRDTTSFVFTHRGMCFLIDCPGSIVQKLLRVGVDYKRMHNVIITHHHPDHMYGIVHLIHAQYVTNTRLTIYTNAHTARILKKIVALMRLDRKAFPRIHYRNVFKNTYFYSSKGVRLKAVANKHILQSFGVKFMFNKKALLYSSDTAPAPRILEEARHCNYLIHDCTASSAYFKKNPSLYRMHTDALTLTNTFSAYHLKKIIPVHFLSVAKNEERLVRRELKPLKGSLLIPKDFQVISL